MVSQAATIPLLPGRGVGEVAQVLEEVPPGGLQSTVSDCHKETVGTEMNTKVIIA